MLTDKDRFLGGNVVRAICSTLFGTSYSEIGGMFHRLRGDGHPCPFQPLSHSLWNCFS